VLVVTQASHMEEAGQPPSLNASAEFLSRPTSAFGPTSALTRTTSAGSRRPPSPSLSSQYLHWGFADGSEHGSQAASPSRPWSSTSALSGSRLARPQSAFSLGSVQSFASDSWSELQMWPQETLNPWALEHPEPSEDPRTHFAARTSLDKLQKACVEFYKNKREEEPRSIFGIRTLLSFRRPRGLDIIGNRARFMTEREGASRDVRLFNMEEERAPDGRTKREVLEGCPFFQQMEAQHQGLIKQLVDVSHFSCECQGQLVYREDDPAQNCYIITDGLVHLHTNNQQVLQGDRAGPPEERRRLSRSGFTPRGSYNPESYSTLTEAKASRARSTEKHRARRYRTAEGHSTFSEDSQLGNYYAVHKAEETGCFFGQGSLAAEECKWDHTAKCLKTCHFLVIRSRDYRTCLKRAKSCHTFFSLNLPGLKQNPDVRPHPNDFFHPEVVSAGHHFLEEGMSMLEPSVYIIFKGQVALKRFRVSAGNPGWLLGGRPMAGPFAAKLADRDCMLLPEIARPKEIDLDEYGLPRIGMPPPHPGTMRCKMLELYNEQGPDEFAPVIKEALPPSEERRHKMKVILKERLVEEGRLREERAIKMAEREKAMEQWRELKRAKEAKLHSPEEWEQIRVDREIARAPPNTSPSRPGSPHWRGPAENWKDFSPRQRGSTEVPFGTVSRPTSGKVLKDAALRQDEVTGSQDTYAVLSDGDMFCSLGFFPIHGAPEPFSAVALTEDCQVLRVQGAHEIQAIPKPLLKAIRFELMKLMRQRLDLAAEKKFIPVRPQPEAKASSPVQADGGGSVAGETPASPVVLGGAAARSREAVRRASFSQDESSHKGDDAAVDFDHGPDSPSSSRPRSEGSRGKRSPSPKSLKKVNSEAAVKTSKRGFFGGLLGSKKKKTTRKVREQENQPRGWLFGHR